MRDAIQDYASRSDRLKERRHMLKVFDRVMARIPAGDQAEANAEIAHTRRPNPFSMIHLDTSVLMDVFSGEKLLAPRLRQFLEGGERISFNVLVLFEWLRWPRIPEQIRAQEALLPSVDSIPFGSAEALRAAAIYRSSIKRPRCREIDIATAACAIVREAQLWTANPGDFKDITDLKLLPFG